MTSASLDAPARGRRAAAAHRSRQRAPRLVGVREFGPKSIAAYLLLFLMLVYCLTPIYWLIVAATKDNTDLFASFGLWLAHVNLWQNLVDT
ncbi:MAG TPA: hypothetical protein VGR57_03625, partial [Ktedonobacterales bacterium]|nr:hypothetical protein [Ktedonobacterales bacterium]